MQTHGITYPKGFRAAGVTCGIKASGKPDLALIVADGPCAAAAVFTVNRMPSAPVIVGRRHLRRLSTRSSGSRAASPGARAVVVNSGNANASTGQGGLADAMTMCEWVAEHVGCAPHEVFVSSTGIIGRPLPMQKIRAGIADAHRALDLGKRADADAAGAIMTTDLVPKTAARTLKIAGKSVRLAGMCKGSGMIAPNMATMLAYITTDAAIRPAALQAALRAATAATFNRISVDQHTSPSDTVLALASGSAGNPLIASPSGRSPGGPGFRALTRALTDLCADLAYQIVKDGEGATRVFRVIVTGARSVADADRVGRAVVDSPLVKCAVHGGDPNWGRITTAAGYSGAGIDPDRMSLSVGDVCVFSQGQPVNQALTSPRSAKRLKKLMAAREITFTLDLGRGSASATWLGCDLSKQYVTINADYTT